MTDKRNENTVRRLMQAGMDEERHPSRARSAVSRARRRVGQRDTLAFALVRIWSALARLLAPLFAYFGEKQARSIFESTSGPAARAGDAKNNDSD